MRALVTGATGFVGRRLLGRLEKPVVLSRDAGRARTALADFDVAAFSWRTTETVPPTTAFEGVDTVFHLAGESVAEGRWTKAKKERLRSSRVERTRNLVDALSQLENKPKVLVSASAVGYYGSRGDEILTETSAPGNDFAAEMCVAWEAEAQRAREAGVRVVNVRIGIVLGHAGGALQKMLLPFRFGLGSPLGNGRQWMPWIHVDDLAALLIFAAKTEAIQFPINGTAPTPVTNREFTKTLGAVLHRPTFFPPVPRFVLRVALGEFATVLVSSQRAVPQAALDAGFRFEYGDLDGALRAILSRASC